MVRSLQHDAGPSQNSGVEERLLGAAGWELRDMRRGDNVEPYLLELAWQRESGLWPPNGIGRIVLGPGVNPDRVFTEHDVDAISLGRSSKFRQGLLEPRLGLGRRAIDQARGLRCDLVLERRSFSQRYRSGPEPSPEIDERERK